ncbi:MAG: ORF6N domain-containing protein [Saprospiraceae bacterium]|uniref:ORF6N domain-containing protein n=1 Tax=Candidatus Opimibacter skivensis TaxID=2982028 RepID=A0A9D7XTD2_9BACT|nr:ORF6N domain-containing protein [Candidatus Opimibacter skivensis]
MGREAAVITDEILISKIYLIRGQKVMLDFHLSELYGVQTKVLKQAVRRNIYVRVFVFTFPEDFLCLY